MSWAREFLRRFHRHQWKDTLWNVYCQPMEQRCSCGEVRHIVGWEDIDMSGGYPGVVMWKDGPHPMTKPIEDQWNAVLLALGDAEPWQTAKSLPRRTVIDNG